MIFFFYLLFSSEHILDVTFLVEIVLQKQIDLIFQFYIVGFFFVENSLLFDLGNFQLFTTLIHRS